jgi:uncharacterized protein HemX
MLMTPEETLKQEAKEARCQPEVDIDTTVIELAALANQADALRITKQKVEWKKRFGDEGELVDTDVSIGG